MEENEWISLYYEENEKREELEQEKCELLGIIQGKDKVIKQAKEIIKDLLSCARNYPEGNLEKMQRAEAFLKE